MPWQVWETPDPSTIEFAKNADSIRAWLRANGIDPATIAHRVIVCNAEGRRRHRYNIHATEYIKDDNGNIIPDYANNRPVTRPLVVPMVTRWPHLR